MNKPNFFIVGAAKCATTAMHTYLHQHPDIFMSPEKEPSYFHVPVTGPQYRRYRGNLDKYLNLFDGVTTEKCIGESSPSYLYSELAAKEIYEFDSEAKILIMLRSPAYLIQSSFYHHIMMGVEKRSVLEDVIREEIEWEQNDENFKENNPLPYHYFDLCLFSRYIKVFRDLFGFDKLQIILLEDFRKDPAKTYNEILDFLGVEKGFMPDFTLINPQKEVRFPGLFNLLSFLHLSPRHFRDSSFFQFARNMLPIEIDRMIINKAKMFYCKPVAVKREMSRDLITIVNDFLSDEIKELSDLIGRDLSCWYPSND